MSLDPTNTISDHEPLIIGHRGASAIAPENTLVAFARAMADGADGIELDVRLARDGVPVVIHDATLRRTGRCEGVVATMSSCELATIDVGSWFNRAYPRLAHADYSVQCVSTLDAVFRYFKKDALTANAVFYIEMKTAQAEGSSLELVRPVVQLIQEHGVNDQVVVVSFNLSALAQIKKVEGGIKTGALFEPGRSAKKLMTIRRMIASSLEHGADEILLHRLIAVRHAVRLAIESKLRPVVWTVDEGRWVRRAANLGIHAVITNDPARMVAAWHRIHSL